MCQHFIFDKEMRCDKILLRFARMQKDRGHIKKYRKREGEKNTWENDTRRSKWIQNDLNFNWARVLLLNMHLDIINTDRCETYIVYTYLVCLDNARAFLWELLVNIFSMCKLSFYARIYIGVNLVIIYMRYDIEKNTLAILS